MEFIGMSSKMVSQMRAGKLVLVVLMATPAHRTMSRESMRIAGSLSHCVSMGSGSSSLFIPLRDVVTFFLSFVQ